METVTFKADDTFVAAMEKTMREHNYTTRTEFIRDAIREKMGKFNDIQHLFKMYGASKRKTTDKQLHESGERAFEELSRRLS